MIAQVDTAGLRALLEILTLQGGHNTTVVMLGAALLGLAGGLVGAFALLRKRSLGVDALSHATLPGLALAFLLAHWLGVAPNSALLLAGAAATGLLAMWCVELVHRHTRLSEDTAIGMSLSVFFGAGIVLLSIIQASGGAQGGLKSFVYGQAASMLPNEVGITGAIALLAIIAALAFHKELALVAFDEAFARVGGWRVSLLDGVLLALITMVTVAGLRSVGAILVVAMLIIPAAAARFWTDRVARVLVLSGAMGAVSAYVGVAVSALAPRAPTGPLIVLSAGAVFLVSMALAPRRGVISSALRRMRVRMQVAQDHALRRLLHAESKDLHFRCPRCLFSMLRVRGLVRLENGSPVLTTAGAARATRIERNHRLWTQYLISQAEIAPSHVDWSVDQVEHVLSPELIAELESELAAASPAPGAA
ncbi:MAG: metal ABC transporter permease [Phycisphaerales bacterium]|nr:metal ABC transporter permease [Phycisphaerales bacterium]